MTAQDVKRYLAELRGHPLESVWIYGGEPFLYPGVLAEVMKISKRNGIAQIGVLTNGYWATSPSAGLRKLSPLKQAGLNAIIISTDGLHAEAVSPDLAINAIRAALKMGFKKVIASVAFIPPRKLSNPINDRSEEIWAKLKGNPHLLLEENPVVFIGRAAQELSDYCQPKKLKAAQKCKPPSYIGGSFDEPQGLEIDPYGWVMICPGFSLGNAQKQPLAKLVEQYGNSGNTLWSIFCSHGPAGLLNLAQEKGYHQRALYASDCHLCYEVRKFLQPYYPEYLAPAGCYNEISRKRQRVR